MALPLLGHHKKRWMIVNVLGGLVEYFDGTKKQAEVRAKKLQLDREIHAKAVAAGFNDQSDGDA